MCAKLTPATHWTFFKCGTIVTTETMFWNCVLESREDVNKDSARASTSINIGISHGKCGRRFRMSKCPDGHVTHAFLVCDV